MARTYRRDSNAKTPHARHYAARFQRDRPVDLSLLSKAFVDLARAMAEHEAQLAAEKKEEAQHEATA